MHEELLRITEKSQTIQSGSLLKSWTGAFERLSKRQSEAYEATYQETQLEATSCHWSVPRQDDQG